MINRSSKRLVRDEKGSLPIILALAMVPLAGFIGGAIDFGRAASERNRLNSMLDAAVIVAAKAAQDADADNKSSSDIKTIAEKAGNDYLGAAKNLPAGTVQKVAVTVGDRSVTVDGTYTSSVSTGLLGILGKKSMPLSGKSSSALNLAPLIDIYLLIDVSGSMAIGATAADIAKLQAKFGCAFACHDGVAVKNGSGKVIADDSFDWAQDNGVMLRINEVNQGISDFVTALQALPSASKRFRIAVYAFSNDVSNVVSLTSNLSTAKDKLPKSPSASSEYEGATHFKEIMPSFTSTVGKTGDGSTTPQKLVIIATDGVQDPNRTWTWNTALRTQVAPFAPASCDALKQNGVSVGVLYAPYIDLSPDWGYLATLGSGSLVGGKGTRFQDIVPQLQACATSPKMFVPAGGTVSVGDAFKLLFANLTSVRLSQ